MTGVAEDTTAHPVVYIKCKRCGRVLGGVGRNGKFRPVCEYAMPRNTNAIELTCACGHRQEWHRRKRSDTTAA